jgi:dehydrogenase/reductase SDR family member 7B
MARVKLTGKVAIITGSSRGIGKAIAVDLARQGMSIVLNGRNEERLAEAKVAVEEVHSSVISVCCDVSIKESGAQLIQAAVDRFGKVDVLVNNVGVSSRGNVADLNPDVFSTVFESNLMGSVFPTIPAIPEIRKTKGSIIFISSLAGIRGLPGLSPYSSSKMALRAIAESIRIEEAVNNIHVGLIFVGVTEIEHNKEAIAPDGSMLTLKSRKDRKVHSMAHVAKQVRKNIVRRKYRTTLTGLGKLNSYMQARFPLLVEKIILKSLHKFEENSH